MTGFNLTTSLSDAYPLTVTNGGVTSQALNPAKSLVAVIPATTTVGAKFWIRQAASVGALPARANVIATTPDLTTTGLTDFLDVARVTAPVIGLYTDQASVVVLVLQYNGFYTAGPGIDGIATGLSRTVLAGLKAVA